MKSTADMSNNGIYELSKLRLCHKTKQNISLKEFKGLKGALCNFFTGLQTNKNRALDTETVCRS